MATTLNNPPAAGFAGPREHGAHIPMNGRPYRWSLSITADNDTFETGVKNISETAITGTRSLTYAGQNTLAFASADVSIVSVSAAGLVTFSSGGAVDFDLLVWANT